MKINLLTAIVAPIMLVLDLLCSAGLVLFALANVKALAALAAVAVVARACHAAKRKQRAHATCVKTA